MIVFSVNIVIIVSIISIVWKASNSTPVKSYFFPALIFKIGTGISLGIIYMFYYKSGDTFAFHDGAAFIVNNLENSVASITDFYFKNEGALFDKNQYLFNEPRSLFFIKILSIIYFITDSNYWISGIYFSLFSFIGGWFLATRIVDYNPKFEATAIISFLYFPSLVFWSSGIMKEALSFAYITIIAGSLISIYQKKHLVLNVIISLVSFYFLWKIKYYIGGILLLVSLAGIISYFLINIFKIKQGKIVLLILINVFVGICISFTHPNFAFNNLFDVILENHHQILKISDPTGVVPFFHYNNQIVQFIINIPVALFAGLFEPLIGQGNGVFAWMTSLLNTTILFLFIGKLINYKEVSIPANSLIIWSVVIYIALLSILLAYTTPNFGTLERYKVSYLPFFLFWVFYNNRMLKLLYNRLLSMEK